MRISDWSSDVCSSDLLLLGARDTQAGVVAQAMQQLDAARVLPLGHFGQGVEVGGHGVADRRLRRAAGAGLAGAQQQGVAREVRQLVVFERRGARIGVAPLVQRVERSEEHTSELQSLMRISYAVFCLKKKI